MQFSYLLLIWAKFWHFWHQVSQINVSSPKISTRQKRLLSSNRNWGRMRIRGRNSMSSEADSWSFQSSSSSSMEKRLGLLAVRFLTLLIILLLWLLLLLTPLCVKTVVAVVVHSFPFPSALSLQLLLLPLLLWLAPSLLLLSRLCWLTTVFVLSKNNSLPKSFTGQLNGMKSVLKFSLNFCFGEIFALTKLFRRMNLKRFVFLILSLTFRFMAKFFRSLMNLKRFVFLCDWDLTIDGI